MREHFLTNFLLVKPLTVCAADRVSPTTAAAFYPKLSGKGLSTGLEELGESRGARCFQACYTLRFVSWKQNLPRDFSGSPVFKTVLSLQGVWVQSLLGELRPHKLCGATKTQTNNKKPL